MKFMIYAGDYIAGFKPRRKLPAGEVYETHDPGEIKILMQSCIAEPVPSPVAAEEPAAPVVASASIVPPEPPAPESMTDERRAEARAILEDKEKLPYKTLQGYARARGIRSTQKRAVLVDALMEWLG